MVKGTGVPVKKVRARIGSYIVGADTGGPNSNFFFTPKIRPLCAVSNFGERIAKRRYRYLGSIQCEPRREFPYNLAMSEQFHFLMVGY